MKNLQNLTILLLFATGTPVYAATAQSKPHSAQSSDTAIEQSIHTRLAKSKIAADKFQFKVQGGVVTIEGKTNVIQRKGAATRMARAAGATTVVNKIIISEEARQKAAANLAKRGDQPGAVKRAQVTTPAQ
jgi:osmotically-inducible protein OsmY